MPDATNPNPAAVKRSGIGLAGRAALITALAFLLAFLTAGLIALNFFERQYIEQTGQHQYKLLRTLADGLDGELQTSRAVLAAAAAQVNAAVLQDQASAERFLDSRTFLRRRFELGLLLVRQEPTPWMASDTASRTQLQDLSPAEVDMLARLRATGQTQLSRVFAGKQGEPVLSMAAAASGGVALVGRLSILSAENAGDLRNHKIGDSGYLFMTTAERLMLMHPDSQRLLRTAATPGQNKGYDLAIDQGFEGSMETTNSTGLRSLSSFARLPSVGWVLAANYPKSEAEAPYWRSVTAVSSLMAVTVISLLALLLLLLNRLFAPLRQLRTQLSQVGAGHAQQFAGQASGEIAEIAQAYNEMIDRLDTSEQARQEQQAMVVSLNEQLEARVVQRTLELQHANDELSASLRHIQTMQSDLHKAEKQASLGRMLSSISHELNTPMGNALCTAEALRARTAALSLAVDDGKLSRSQLNDFLQFSSQSSELVERNLARAANLLDNYKQLSELPMQHLQHEVGLRRLADELLHSHQAACAKLQVQVVNDIPADLSVAVDASSLTLIIDKLLMNALDHGIAEGSAAQIRLSARLDDKQLLVLEVQDNGAGIAAADLGRVFDPMFTTKLAQGHSGLGLTLVHRLATEVLGGEVRLHNLPGLGLRVEIRLPVQQR